MELGRQGLEEPSQSVAKLLYFADEDPQAWILVQRAEKKEHHTQKGSNLSKATRNKPNLLTLGTF